MFGLFSANLPLTQPPSISEWLLQGDDAPTTHTAAPTAEDSFMKSLAHDRHLSSPVIPVQRPVVHAVAPAPTPVLAARPAGISAALADAKTPQPAAAVGGIASLARKPMGSTYYVR